MKLRIVKRDIYYIEEFINNKWKPVLNGWNEPMHVFSFLEAEECIENVRKTKSNEVIKEYTF